MRNCESCENFKKGKCTEYGRDVDLYDGCSNHIYSDEFYFQYREKVWDAIERCDNYTETYLKECEPDLYKMIMEELNAIQNINFIKVRLQ